MININPRFKFYFIYNAVTTECAPSIQNLVLTYKRVPTTMHYEQEIKDDLVFYGDDFTFLKNIEDTNPCGEVQFRVDQLCDGAYVTKFTGLISLVTGAWNIDKCVVKIKCKANSIYNSLFSGIELNVINLISSTITTRRAATWDSPSYSVFTRMRSFGNLLTKLLINTTPELTTIKSDFFQINEDNTSDYNYVTGEFNPYTEMYFCHATEYVAPEPSNAATTLKVSLKQILEDLNTLFNVFISVDGVNLRIEHESYFETNNYIDLSLDYLPEKANTPNAYKWTDGYKYEIFQAEDCRQKVRLKNTGSCASTSTKVNNVRKILIDTDLVFNDNGAISDKNKLVLVATGLYGGNRRELGLFNDELKLQVLVRRFHRYGKSFSECEFEVFDSTLTYDSSLENQFGFGMDFSKGQKEVEANSAIVCCDESIPNPYDEVRVPLGDGSLDQFELNLSTGRLLFNSNIGNRRLTEITQSNLPDQISDIFFWSWVDLTTVTLSAGKVKKWHCQAGTGNYFVQNTAASMPITFSDLLPGVNAIYFDGSDDVMMSDGPGNGIFAALNDTDYTVFILGNFNPGVHKFIVGSHSSYDVDGFGLSTEASSSYTWIGNYRQTLKYNLKYPFYHPNKYDGAGDNNFDTFVFCERRSGNTSYGYYNGNLHLTADSANPMNHAYDAGFGSVHLGAFANSFGPITYTAHSSFYMVEMLIVQKAVTDDELHLLHKYFFKKYKHLKSYVTD